MACFQASESVVAPANVEIASPGAEILRTAQVGCVQTIRFVLNEISVSGEASARREEETLVLGRDFEKTLESLETEGQRVADELGIVVGRVDSSSPGERVADGVDRRLSDGTTRKENRERGDP